VSTHRSRGPRAFTSLALGVLAALACGGDSSGPATSSVTSITLQFTSSTLSLGAQEGFGATFRDASGATVTDPSDATWKSSNVAIATVDKNGRVSAIALGGPVTVTVTAGTGSATATFSVVPNKVNFSPAPPTLGVNETLQLTATPLDIAGVPISAALAPVTWSSNTQSVATVGTTTGLMTGVAPGNVRITATAAGQSNNLDFEIGVVSPYDGRWSGLTTNASRPIDITVTFGSVRLWRITYYLFVAPYSPTCTASVSAVSVPNVAIANAAYAFNLTTPAVVPVTGTFTSNTAMTGNFSAMNLGSFSCNLLDNGAPTTNVVYTASIPAGTFTAAKQ
jgi:hypothetical protein